MFRPFTIFTVAAAILIAAAAALAVAPGLDQNSIIDSVTVAMAVVGAQARAVIRVSELYKFTGLRRSQIEQLFSADF
jgi:hypothetical protein